MEWEKKGVIYATKGDAEWSRTHAQVPFACTISRERLRIYYGTRDSKGRTRTSYIEVDADNFGNVVYVHDQPILPLGKLGTFDENGVMPSWFVKHDEMLYFYYLGWNVGRTIRYRVANGLALSRDNGATFERVSEGPIMDRTLVDPYSLSTQCVLRDGDVWKTWYMSYTGWQVVDDLTEPSYVLKYAESSDGMRWKTDDIVCIGSVDNPRECIARPSVLKQNGRYLMWYSYRDIQGYRSAGSTSYRIGYAESDDGIAWDRKDVDVGMAVSPEGWDSEMIAYPHVFMHNGRLHMLYNGNGFGQSGFGYAVLKNA